MGEIQRITNLGMEGKLSLKESLKQRITLLEANRDHLGSVIDTLRHKVSDSVVRNRNFFKQNAENICKALGIKTKRVKQIVKDRYNSFVTPPAIKSIQYTSPVAKKDSEVTYNTSFEKFDGGASSSAFRCRSSI